MKAVEEWEVKEQGEEFKFKLMVKNFESEQIKDYFFKPY